MLELTSVAPAGTFFYTQLKKAFGVLVQVNQAFLEAIWT